ncbi:MAG: hypothetical protein V3S14_09655, partial [Anaerolineae bacterium]
FSYHYSYAENPTSSDWTLHDTAAEVSMGDTVLVGIAHAKYSGSGSTVTSVADEFVVCQASDEPMPPAPGMKECVQLFEAGEFEGNAERVFPPWVPGATGPAWQRTGYMQYEGAFSMRLHASLGSYDVGCPAFDPWFYQTVQIPTEIYSMTRITVEGYRAIGGSLIDCSIENSVEADDALYVQLLDGSGGPITGLPLYMSRAYGKAGLMYAAMPADRDGSSERMAGKVRDLAGSKLAVHQDDRMIIPNADDTGWLSPSADQADSGGDGDGFEINPSNAYADGSSYAESRDNGNSTDQTDRHRFYDYDFAVPADATVEGIEVRLDWWMDAPPRGNSTLGVDLSWDGGASWTVPQVDSQDSITEHTAILGAVDDMWNRTWLPDEFSNTNFRVRVHSFSSMDDRDFYLDWVPVRVTFSTPTPTPTSTSTPTSTLTPSPTPTSTLTPSPTSTPTPGPTSTPTVTPTVTPTPTPTGTPAPLGFIVDGGAAAGQWEHFSVDFTGSVDLPSLAGQDVQVRFYATHDGDEIGTWFYLDNVENNICTQWPIPEPEDGTASIGGQVFGGTSGYQLMTGVRVMAYSQGGEVYQTVSIQDGTYHFYNIPPGNYFIYAEAWVGGTLTVGFANETVVSNERNYGIALYLR